MALFGLFGKKDPETEAKKLQAKATKKFGPSENRMKALEELRALEHPAGWMGMLQRFTLRTEPGITDEEEKQYVYQSLVDVGPSVVPSVKEFVVRSEHPTWGLRVLEKLVPKEEVVETILQALDREGPDYTRDPEKKLTLVRHLNQFEDERIPQRLVPYLSDPSEDVVVAVLEVVSKQPHEALAEPLVEVLLRAHEIHSERLRTAAAEALQKTELSVKGHTPAVTAALPPGFSVGKGGVVQAAARK